MKHKLRISNMNKRKREATQEYTYSTEIIPQWKKDNRHLSPCFSLSRQVSDKKCCHCKCTNQ